MIEIEVTDQQKERAQNLYDFDALNGSIMKGSSNIYGAMGEVVVVDYFTKLYHLVWHQTYDYDMIIKGKRVDVKTKKYNIDPQPDMNCTIPDHSPRQKCDYYFFTYCREDLSKVFILGYIGKKDFWEKAVLKKKGEHDVGNFYFRCDTRVIKIEQLNKFKI